MVNPIEKKQPYDLDERLINFSVRILNVVEALPNGRTGNHLAGQLLRSGTSPAPNHAEIRVPNLAMISSTK